MQIERVDHHEIIGQAEILHGEPIAIDQAAAGGFRYFFKSRHPLGIDGGIVTVGETELAATGHVAELIDVPASALGPRNGVRLAMIASAASIMASLPLKIASDASEAVRSTALSSG